MKKVVYSLLAMVILLGYFAFAPKASAAAAKPFDWQLITQSPYPAQLEAGAIANVWVEVKNTGTVTWYRDGISNVVRLGSGSKYGSASQQRDYTSEFFMPESTMSGAIGWLSANRPVKIMHPEVRSGWHTRFQFDIKAPATPGTYKAYFTPVVEGVEWMKDIGLYWQITVVAPTACIEEGGSLGAVVLGNTVECCEGLVAYVPFHILGNRGTCKRPLTPEGQAPSIVGLVFSPSGDTSIQSGQTTYYSVGALYDNWTTQDVTGMSTLSVVYDTGSGVIDPDGRFIAGSIGTCKIHASYNGKTADSGTITITGL
ncbi:MAG TPA: hypothetical protein P5096_02300 [Patescibacteria group bacterium]|nr:hypothetical protein [Patescibacteria group bacterium]